MNDVAGLRTTYGSFLYKDNIATEDEFIVAHSKLVVDTRNATLGIKAPKGRIWKA